MTLGVGPAEQPAWAYLALGAGGFWMSGMDNVESPPSGTVIWGGVGFPRVAGLLLGVRHHVVDEETAFGAFEFTTLSVQLVSAKRWLYFSLGGELQATSTRDDSLDAFGGGPDFRFFMEIGARFGGVPLSR